MNQDINREIKDERMEKYLDTTRRALDKVRIAPPARSHLRKVAKDFLDMARSYHSDALVFARDGDFVLAYGAVNYAHGWLDAGARFGLFDVDEDDQLFTKAEMEHFYDLAVGEGATGVQWSGMTRKEG